MRKVALTDVCDFQGGTQPPKDTWIKEPREGYVRMLQIRDFTQPKKDNIEYVPHKNTLKTCLDDDILIGRYGASVGKICRGLSGAYNVALIKTIPDTDALYKEYFYYILKSDYFYHFINNVGGRAAQAGFNKGDLTEFKIPLPPLPIQKKIAAILDAADAYRQKTKALIEKYDELAQSLFLDMFGDPVRNEKGWEVISLFDYGDFKNGLNFKSNEIGNIVKYIGVGDFKTYYKINDIEKLSSVSLTTIPSQNYFLKNGDLLLVRSNGNRNLVGRCLIVFPNNTLVTYSGFCIRYRIQNDNLSPMFLAFLFRNESFKKYMLSGGRGANIQNINQKMLNGLKIIKPQIECQNKFEASLTAIEAQKENASKCSQKAEELFQSLLQKAFKGNLI